MLGLNLALLFKFPPAYLLNFYFGQATRKKMVHSATLSFYSCLWFTAGSDVRAKHPTADGCSAPWMWLIAPSQQRSCDSAGWGSAGGFPVSSSAEPRLLDGATGWVWRILDFSVPVAQVLSSLVLSHDRRCTFVLLLTAWWAQQLRVEQLGIVSARQPHHWAQRDMERLWSQCGTWLLCALCTLSNIQQAFFSRNGILKFWSIEIVKPLQNFIDFLLCWTWKK